MSRLRWRWEWNWTLRCLVCPVIVRVIEGEIMFRWWWWRAESKNTGHDEHNVSSTFKSRCIRRADGGTEYQESTILRNIKKVRLGVDLCRVSRFCFLSSSSPTYSPYSWRPWNKSVTVVMIIGSNKWTRIFERYLDCCGCRVNWHSTLVPTI